MDPLVLKLTLELATPVVAHRAIGYDPISILVAIIALLLFIIAIKRLMLEIEMALDNRMWSPGYSTWRCRHGHREDINERKLPWTKKLQS